MTIEMIQEINTHDLLKVKKLAVKAEILWRYDAAEMAPGELRDYEATARAVTWVAKLIRKMEKKNEKTP